MNTTETKQLQLSIWKDSDYSENPLTDWGLNIELLYSSNRYTLGTQNVDSFAEEMMNLLNYSETYQDRLFNKYGDTKELFFILVDRINKKGFIALPVYAYIHSGIALKTTPFNDNFDSGLSGLIYIKKEDYRHNFEVKRINKSIVENYLICMLENYNDFINGNIYGFSVIDENGECIDSCGGFIGDNYAINMSYHINNEDYNMTENEVIEYIKSLEISY